MAQDNPQPRFLKVVSKFVKRTYDSVFFPEIRLYGKWLKEAGFTPGQHIAIRQEGESLIISPARNGQPLPQIGYNAPAEQDKPQASRNY